MNPGTATPPLRIEKAAYSGGGLARTGAGEVVFVPFALPGELVQPAPGGGGALTVLEPSSERVAPGCVHFGTCGGCQYQMASYPEQLRLKATILRETLARAGSTCALPPEQVWPCPQPWEYRNRIRLRVREAGGALRLGYSRRGSQEFLPITMCPLAAPLLWQTAEALMAAAATSESAAAWLRAAAEVELSVNDDASRVQVHLLCPGPVPLARAGLAPFAEALRAAGISLAGVGASRLHVVSGRATSLLAEEGAEGLLYRVGEERFWLGRGSFFQVNRFLLPTLVELVADARSGELAWDLFAGVGLFSRALGRRFAGVTAVEANPAAIPELRRGLGRPSDTVVEQTTLAFLKGAVLERARPELIVLDPPRAGAGEEACALLLRLRPAEIVYVSCDPTTLARDLFVLGADYGVRELHMIDLFPQTYHLETVMVLHRKDLAS